MQQFTTIGMIAVTASISDIYIAPIIIGPIHLLLSVGRSGSFGEHL
ncbi:hypothetical protein SBA1_140014 [Candidatus Sulfotelmatobacter kueseliae]|uniref:Uncharacterized protein n=1 Tax=Candidatus Sulfotelmatobacter kueseliae TaxID=2042962 RepID=A0A2U3K616_9BACT|nr:hypothetical protein SBA1_140014 [Candidatus Sulfotelmatobacter kueseliae]